MNRSIFDRAALMAHALAARARTCAIALLLPMLALVAMPAAGVTNAWAPADSLSIARYGHTSTLLSSGKVLVAGGSASVSLSSAELYDPATNAWDTAGSLATARVYHTATLLPSGKVLVAGGRNGGSYFASAELYDPATDAWTSAGNMSATRYGHTATLLPSGKVLVVGGANGSVLANVDLYDPVTNTWSAAGTLTDERLNHTATLLPTGKVLVAAGRNGGGALASAQLYDPATNTWSAAGTPTAQRYNHTATLLPSGDVLVAGGQINASSPIAAAELYDPATNTWAATGSLADARYSHSATLLPSGKVLVAGGGGAEGILGSAELYDPATNTWGSMSFLGVRYNHTATLLPSGQVLVAGGVDGGILASAERYDPAAGAMVNADSVLATSRDSHTATLLPSGQVLVAGGYRDSGGTLASAERYDPATNTWIPDGNLATARQFHTATLLPSGKVLVAGGYRSSPTPHLDSAELFDPATGTWSAGGALVQARYGHVATLLPSGKVLVAGGYGSSGVVASAELYDPATNTWSATGNLTLARGSHVATLLLSGKVLLIGGEGVGGAITSTELYDPVTGTWSAGGALAQARYGHAATLLPSGKVLVTAGSIAGPDVSAELYDPATDTWSAAGSLVGARQSHTATLLPSGKVLVAGGLGNSGFVASIELYDPVANTWHAAGSLAESRYSHTATLLPSGQVLMAGGYNHGGHLASVERYDPGLAPVAALQPDVSAVDAFLLQTSAIVATSPGSATVANAATATGFLPLREGSGGGFQQSASNAPVFQLQRIDNGQMRFVPNDGSVAMSDTTFTGSADALAGFPAGPVLVRVWVNGVPSAARHSTLAVSPGRPVVPVASGGVAQATVDFAALTETGGAPVTSYVATATPGGATASCTAPCTSIGVSPLAPGDYTFTVHATNAAGNGPESPASNIATVTEQMVPMLDWSAPAAIAYGTPLDATQLNATATHDGDPVPGTFAYTPPAGSVLPVGDAQPLSVTFTPTDTVQYTSATMGVSIDVTRAPLAVSGTSVQDKPYDGSATATLVGGTLVGVLAADAGNVTLIEAGSFAQGNVGTGIAVTANDSISGSAAGSYTLVQPTGLSANITPVTLTFTATPATIPYGATPGGLAGTVSGFIPGESQATATTGTLGFTTTATASSAVGQYPIDGGGLSANNGNYVFEQDAANATALTIVAASTTTTITNAQPWTITFGADATVAVTVVANAPSSFTPAGTVTVSDGGAGSGDQCTIVLPAASCMLTPSGAGIMTVSATFTPDAASGANVAGSSASATLTIERAEQATLSLVATPAVLLSGMDSQLSASGGSGTGAVTYAVDSGPCSVDGSVATATGAGTCIVRAIKAGDAEYEQASATAMITVKSDIVTDVEPAAGGSVTCTPDPVDFGADATCTASAATGYVFDHWSGDCEGEGACVLADVQSDQTVTAHFVVEGAPTVRLSVSVDNGRDRSAPGDTVEYDILVRNASSIAVENIGLSTFATPDAALSDLLWQCTPVSACTPDTDEDKHVATTLRLGAHNTVALSLSASVGPFAGSFGVTAVLDVPPDYADSDALDNIATDTDSDARDLILNDGFEQLP